MLIYSVCYYYENNNKQNIIEHIKCFNNIKGEKIFAIQIMVDNLNITEKIKEDFTNFFVKNNISNFDIIINFNWGGTILGLWLVYKKFYTLSENKQDTYIAHFEEDFRPINNKWLDDSINKLNDGNYFIGESNNNEIHTGNFDGRITGKNYKNTVRLGDPEVWLDGGYYFSNLEKLNIIHEHIGIFHKGNPKTKYTNLVDGISIGEVGFPTLVYHSQLKFGFLDRHDYFKHYG